MFTINWANEIERLLMKTFDILQFPVTSSTSSEISGTLWIEQEIISIKHERTRMVLNVLHYSQ